GSKLTPRAFAFFDLRRPAIAPMVTRALRLGKHMPAYAARRWDLTINDFSRSDLDSKAGQTDIGAFRRGQQSDRGDAEILENLSAKPDLAPLLRAGRFGAARDGMGGDAGCAIAQEYDDAAAFALETLQRKLDGMGISEYVADDVGAVQARQDVFAL